DVDGAKRPGNPKRVLGRSCDFRLRWRRADRQLLALRRRQNGLEQHRGPPFGSRAEDGLSPKLSLCYAGGVRSRFTRHLSKLWPRPPRCGQLLSTLATHNTLGISTLSLFGARATGHLQAFAISSAV